MLFYAGGETLGVGSGLKYARWAWASAQAGTRFEVLASSASFTVTGSGTSAMSCRTFGSSNNTAMADFNSLALLVPRPTAAPAGAHAIPALGTPALALLLAALADVGARELRQRRRHC